MAAQIHLLFSSDYELYFGENYLPEREVLIEPTQRILDAFEAEGIPMNLFADVASVWRYHSLKVESDYILLFEEQLRRAIHQGHDVQLHLHPHWMSSGYDGRRWLMDESKFKLSDLGYGERKYPHLENANELIHRGKKYLENLLRPIDPSYQCMAFRAGGYGIQPREKELIGALLSAGFKIDSSIVPGMFFKSNVNEIDFRRIPKQINYRMGTRYGIYKEDSQGIFEIPIVAYSESILESLIHRLGILKQSVYHHLRKKGDLFKNELRPRGKSIQTNSSVKHFLSLVLRPSLFLLEFTGPHVEVKRMITGTARFIEAKLKESPDIYISASCHPKNVFLPTIEAMKEFWKSMVRYYGKNIEAITFRDAAKAFDKKSMLLLGPSV
jgi:hypothetical protein